jgi:protocatechuate 3,4-dioxygenase beta subunit
MKMILVFLLLFCNYVKGTAQPDSLSLLNEVVSKFQNKLVSVSTTLTDKKYLSIHPATAFRELIKVNATTDILKITTPAEPGKKIRVLGIVQDKNGKPIAGALVYLYQTDYRGWYAADAPHVLQYEGDIRHARLFGYVKTNENGKFELHTVKPSGYPRSDLPAHIHVHVDANDYKPYSTEFLFDDDERLIGNIREQSIRNQFLISKPEKTTASFEQQFSYKMVVKKE